LGLLAAAVLAGLLVCAATAPVAAQEQPPDEAATPVRPEVAPRRPEAAAGIRDEADKVGEEAGAAATALARKADSAFKMATERADLGWVLFVVSMVVGLVTLFYGWSIIQSLLVPSAPFWGLMTGGAIAFFMVAAFFQQEEIWFKLLLLTVGVAFGFGLYLFSALRAKPVAAFLVIMSPFLMLAAFLLPQHELVGLAVFVAGFVAGFAAMVEVRPLAIISTSLLGGFGLLCCAGLLSHLTSDQAQWFRGAFTYLIERPLITLITIGVVAFVGGNFQFMTGPRGGLED
jgi:hypothetical protein